MATVSADQAAAGYPLFSGGSGQVMCAYGVYEIAAALSQDDLIEFCKIPANSVVIGGWLRADDLDTGTEALEIDVGTSDDPDMFLNSGVLTGDAIAEVKPEVGIMVPLHGVLKDGPKLLTEETTILGKIIAAANAGGTGTVSVTVLYIKNVSTGA